MKLVILTYGTEGDTRPLAALNQALREWGHDVCLLGRFAHVRSGADAGTAAGDEHDPALHRRPRNDARLEAPSRGRESVTAMRAGNGDQATASQAGSSVWLPALPDGSGWGLWLAQSRPDALVRPRCDRATAPRQRQHSRSEPRAFSDRTFSASGASRRSAQPAQTAVGQASTARPQASSAWMPAAAGRPGRRLSQTSVRVR